MVGAQLFLLNEAPGAHYHGDARGIGALDAVSAVLRLCCYLPLTVY